MRSPSFAPGPAQASTPVLAPAPSRAVIAVPGLAVAFALAIGACGARPGIEPGDDGRVSPDAAPRDAAPGVDAYPPPTCTLPSPNVDVRGTTPLGEVSFGFGFAALTGGECASGLRLFFFAQDTVEGWDLPEPRLDLFATPGPETGRHTVEVWLVVDGESASTAGEVEVTSFDDWWQDPTGSVHGRLDILGDGWSLQAEFSVPYCDLLMMWCV